MAPVGQITHDTLESMLTNPGHLITQKLTFPKEQMKDIIQNLYELMVQVYNYDTNHGRSSRDILAEKLYTHASLPLPSPLLTSQPAK